MDAVAEGAAMPVPTAAATPTSALGGGETTDKATGLAQEAAAAAEETATTKKTHGFGVVFAAIGVLIAAVLLRKKNG